MASSPESSAFFATLLIVLILMGKSCSKSKHKYSVNPLIFGSRKAQSLRTLKGAATLKIQCDTAFTEHLHQTIIQKEGENASRAKKKNLVIIPLRERSYNAEPLNSS